MRVFLLDLWLDLREKRLAPIAIVLLAAIVAVPVVLAKKGDKGAPAPAQSASSASAATPVVADDAQAATSSKLQTYSARDPFEPTSKAKAPASSSTSGSASGTGSDSTSGGSSASSGGSSGMASTGGGAATVTEPGGSYPNLNVKKITRNLTQPTGSTPSTGGGGSTGRAPSTGGGGSTGSGPSTGGDTSGGTKTTLFTYTIDIRYGPGGSVKAYKDVKRLDLIPDAAQTKLVFLGVTTSGKTAVFLVSNDVGVDTGGKCRPSADKCNFLYLRADGDHDQAMLTGADGSVYHVRLLAINRVTVASLSAKSGGSARGSSTDAKSDSPPPFQQLFGDTSQAQTR